MEDIKLIGQRIKEMREILEISYEEMANLCDISVDEYKKREAGERDFTFTFLNKCATKFNLDLTELLTGESAHLKSYTIDRKDKGLSVERKKGFDYRLLGAKFNNKIIYPYLVTVPYEKEAKNKPIRTSSHSGQEMDYILEGRLKISIDGKQEILNEGDCIYYDSALPHGMIATNGNECKFLAILMHR